MSVLSRIVHVFTRFVTKRTGYMQKLTECKSVPKQLTALNRGQSKRTQVHDNPDSSNSTACFIQQASKRNEFLLAQSGYDAGKSKVQRRH